MANKEREKYLNKAETVLKSNVVYDTNCGNNILKSIFLKIVKRSNSKLKTFQRNENETYQQLPKAYIIFIFEESISYQFY